MTLDHPFTPHRTSLHLTRASSLKCTLFPQSLGPFVPVVPIRFYAAASLLHRLLRVLFAAVRLAVWRDGAGTCSRDGDGDIHKALRDQPLFKGLVLDFQVGRHGRNHKVGENGAEEADARCYEEDSLLTTSLIGVMALEKESFLSAARTG